MVVGNSGHVHELILPAKLRDKKMIRGNLKLGTSKQERDQLRFNASHNFGIEKRNQM